MANNIDFSDMSGLISSISTMDRDIEKQVEVKVSQLAERVRTDVQFLCPVQTGELRQSIKTRTYKDDDGSIVGEVYTNKEYGAYVEFGTGIVGQQAGLVRDGITLMYRQTPWRYQDDEGNWHYTHGQKPQPFLYPAMKQNEEDIVNELSKIPQMIINPKGK